jgi:hypothetical protein
MSLLSSIGRVIAAPITIPFEIAKAVAPAATSLLQGVVNTGFEAAKFATGAMGMMSLPLMNPMLAIGANLAGSALNGMQGMANGVFNGINGSFGRDVPYSPYGQVFTPPLYDRMGMGGFAGQIGGGLISQAFGAIAGGAGVPGVGGVFDGGVTPSSTFGSNVPIAPGVFNPTGSTDSALVNTIANAPLFSQDEKDLMAKLPPEQQAMMTLQARKQREALMTSVLTNIANMKHESLKGIANNLRG